MIEFLLLVTCFAQHKHLILLVKHVRLKVLCFFCFNKFYNYFLLIIFSYL
jgi:hypothetical protein